MKILMITHKDGHNVSLSKIADAFLRKGHEVIIYAPFYAENVLRFFNKEIPRFPVSYLTEESAKDCDIIFLAAIAMFHVVERDLLSIHKPIIVHNYLTNGTIMSEGDFCFVPSLPTAETEYDKYMHYSRMEIGEPKYDSINQDATDSKKFLFIDSGHYPFGREAKRELAKTLLNICKAFPDYELWIKPRFLPEDEIITHRNDFHLYDVIRKEADGEVPGNLIMLTEHRDLMELIAQSKTVLCMYTTAFSGTYVLDKGLLVLDGLPSEDVYDVRMKVFNRVKRIMMDSGAVIHYSKVNEFLPEGVKCSSDYFRYLLAERENTADKICEATEYLFDNFYQKQIFPKVCECSYQDYRQILQEDRHMTWEEIISNRYENFLIQQMLELIDYNINASLDISYITDQINRIRKNGFLTDRAFKQMREDIGRNRNLCIVGNKDLLLKDDIDSGALLVAYYELKQYDEIIHFPKQDIGAFHFFRGYVAYEQEENELALRELEEYMQYSLGREYAKEVSDMQYNRFEAFYIIIRLLSEKGEEEKAKFYLKEMKSYYANIYSYLQDKEVIVNTFQGVHYTYIHWAEGAINHCAFKEEGFAGRPILVYGAGVISKRILLKNPLLRDRITAFVDRYSNLQDLEGIPIVRPDQIKSYGTENIIIIAVPHQVKNIKADLLKIRNDMQIISVNDLF